MHERLLLFIPDLAHALGLTQNAVRISLSRRDGRLPPSFRLGTKHAWRIETVKKWLEEREAEGVGERRRRGRPRKVQ